MAEAPIDVRTLIASVPPEEHARRAEAYATGVDETHWSFRKPFVPLSKIGPNLTRLGSMLEAADVSAGHRVLDFGCGVAWLGRILAQSGCEVVATDVAGNLLEAAARHDARFHPELAGKLRYVPTDGAQIPLPDGSLDRILCHEALHHVPDQEGTIAEFRRLLAPGGRAVFMEPGPDHSQAASSQSEMRAHGVIENDIHVERIWEVAQRAGFARIEVGLFAIRPQMLDLDRFLALWQHEMRGGPPPEPPASATYRQLARPVLQGFRMFVLHADPPGSGLADSTSPEGLLARIEVLFARRVEAGVELKLAITNTGTRSWRPSGSGRGEVNLGLMLLDGDAALLNRNWRRHPIAHRITAPGETLRTRFTVPLPEEARLALDLVAEDVRWFSQPGLGVVPEIKPMRRQAR